MLTLLVVYVLLVVLYVVRGRGKIYSSEVRDGMRWAASVLAVVAAMALFVLLFVALCR